MNAKDKYVKLVSGKIHCKKEKKADYLQLLRKSLDDVAGDNISVKQLIAECGEPKKTASDFEQNLEQKEIKKYKRKKLLQILIPFLIILLFFIGFLIYVIYTNTNPGYNVIEPVIVE